jgi:uncharacterized protein
MSALIPAATASWAAIDDDSAEASSLRFENDGWTLDGIIEHGAACQYAVRMSADFEFRQFVLFRDQPEPDLWLAIDRFGAWGEVNGATRNDLLGCTTVDLACSAISPTLVIRRLEDAVEIGEAYEALVAVVDAETLGVVPVKHRYERLDETSWRFRLAGEPAAAAVEFDVDDDGFVFDYPGRFTRTN